MKFRISNPGTWQASPGGSRQPAPTFMKLLNSSQPESTATAVNPTRPCCYVGIDFGTSGTGCTYAFGSDTSQIRVLGNLPGVDKLDAKTATALLYEVQQNGDWVCIEWGERAMQRYRFSNAADQAKWRLLEGKQFKLALANYSSFQNMGFPKSYSMPEDCPFTPGALITELLSKLHQHLVAYVKRHDRVDIMSSDVDVHYCLSVPAGWSPGAKNIMRRAAEAAGFKKPVMLADSTTRSDLNHSQSDTSNQSDCTSRRSPVGSMSSTCRAGSSASSLRDDVSSSVSLGYNGALEASAISIVYEQEAAALSACSDPWDTWGDLRAHPGDVWVIVDAGGGTVDIAMHAVKAGEQPGESQLSELLQSACLPYGSTVLDNMAEALLIKPMVASDTAYQRWKSDHPGDFMRQMRKWQDCKYEFDGENELTMGLVESFLECLPAASPYRSQVIRNLDTASMKRVFEPVVSQITSQVKSMVSQQRSTDGRVGADVLLLCGGFGANDYLKSQLEKHCGDYIGKVVRPTEPLQAVQLGNTIHVLRPRSITARCSRLTYGLRCCGRVSPECQAVGQILTTGDGRELCAAHFKPLVHAGEIVQLDQRTEPWIAQMVPGSDVVRLDVFATEMETGVHVTEDHMMNVGEVEFEVTRKSLGRSMRNMLGWQDAADSAASSGRTLEISFLFGAAEIIVEAKKVGSKKAVRTTIKFANEPARQPVALRGT